MDANLLIRREANICTLSEAMEATNKTTFYTAEGLKTACDAVIRQLTAIVALDSTIISALLQEIKGLKSGRLTSSVADAETPPEGIEQEGQEQV